MNAPTLSLASLTTEPVGASSARCETNPFGAPVAGLTFSLTVDTAALT